MMSEMKNFWKDVGEQIDQGNEKTYLIILKLQNIEELLLKDLPASNRDKLQACFSSLCVKVDTDVKNIIEYCIKIQQSRLSDCFRHLPSYNISTVFLANSMFW